MTIYQAIYFAILCTGLFGALHLLGEYFVLKQTRSSAYKHVRVVRALRSMKSPAMLACLLALATSVWVSPSLTLLGCVMGGLFGMVGLANDPHFWSASNRITSAVLSLVYMYIFPLACILNITLGTLVTTATLETKIFISILVLLIPLGMVLSQILRGATALELLRD